MDLSIVAVSILGGLVAVRWGILLLGAALIVRNAESCPACFAPTILLRRRLLRLILPIAEWRWCPACRWQGPSRKKERSRWTSKSEASRT